MVLIKPGKVNYLDSDEDVKDEAVTCAEMPKANDDHKTPLQTKNTPVLRSSKRIQRRQSRTFRKPKREDELKKIPTLGTPSKSIRSLKPRPLVNNLMRETHRYNYDPSYTSGESSTEDFINDEDEDDSSKSEDSLTSGQRKSLKRKLSSSEDEETNDRKTKITDDLRNREIDDEDDIQNVSIKSRAVISSSDSESSDVDQIGVKSANSHKGLTTVASSDDDDGGDHDCIKQSETVKRKLDFCTEKQERDNTNGDHDDGYDDDDDDDDEQCQSGDRDDDDDESDDSSDVCLASQSSFKSPRAALMQRRRDRQRRKFAKLLEIRKRQNHDRNLLTISE